ncbi:MAG: hypothetical protein H7838_01920 [Magnetococcus sp. DMHC-8]
MNETNLHHETISSAPPPGWLYDTSMLLSGSNGQTPADEGRARFHLDGLLEQHAGEKGNLISVALLTEGIAPRGAFGNGVAEDIDGETDPFLHRDTVRPGTSLRLSLWGRMAARKTGQEAPTQLAGEFAYRRSNALLRRYTQWHPVQPQQ